MSKISEKMLLGAVGRSIGNGMAQTAEGNSGLRASGMRAIKLVRCPLFDSEEFGASFVKQIRSYKTLSNVIGSPPLIAISVLHSRKKSSSLNPLNLIIPGKLFFVYSASSSKSNPPNSTFSNLIP
jgi:hypothetical protein